MRYLALVLLFASCSPVPAVGIELAGDQVVASPEEKHKLSQCHRHGGCLVLTQAELVRVLQQVQAQTIEIAAGVAAQEIEAAGKLCRRIGI